MSTITTILDLISRSHLAMGVLSVVTAPIVIGVTLTKFRNGNLRLSQGRTKRLYDIMNRKQGGCSASSGALQIAVKDMLGIELPGDAIRFALERDSPLTLLRNIQQAGVLVKFHHNEKCFKDARTRPRLSLQQIFQALILLAIVPYVALIFVGIVFKFIEPIKVAALLTLDLIAMPMIIKAALRADAAARLLKADTVYPPPHPKVGLRDADRSETSPRPRKRRTKASGNEGTAQEEPTRVTASAGVLPALATENV
ncbi:hypothetical protein FSO04_30785 [Paraburkholderia madseniana]|uniref:Uncharacterized protein n=1 Tax=Paraburkholderia madseniana TaxID=2599607 RepID=A0A6N6W640_9BURK|nr:hypothetical protein [Paraburkholderia madseniana]KAE8756092.1 hypothetical protein FSO04_30785 [Paraburkholderia madseniana]